jgi:hypothetical protein
MESLAIRLVIRLVEPIVDFHQQVASSTCIKAAPIGANLYTELTRKVPSNKRAF